MLEAVAQNGWRWSLPFFSLNANQQIKNLSKIFQDLYHFNCFMRGATKLYFELRYWNLKLETCP